MTEKYERRKLVTGSPAKMPKGSIHLNELTIDQLWSWALAPGVKIPPHREVKPKNNDTAVNRLLRSINGRPVKHK